MKEHIDWTGRVTQNAEQGESITRSIDWTSHPLVSIGRSPKWDKDVWIGPGILAIVLTYLGGVWWLTEWIRNRLGEELAWAPTLIMFLLVIPFPAVGIMYAIGTGINGFMSPLAFLRWLRSIPWGDSSPSDGSSSSSYSYDDGGGSGGGSFGGGGTFGGGGGGGTW